MFDLMRVRGRGGEKAQWGGGAQLDVAKVVKTSADVRTGAATET
jgi:hypothetical protein